jgi:glyoxylase-like metal-dependent hydrolase (beta-lactamase superfamily II)
MKSKKTILGLAIMMSIVMTSQAQDLNQIPITRTRVTNNITLYRIGETGVFSNMTAVNTSEGVVVFDALMFPELATKVRGMIEKDFGKKIACLINTHGAMDHTNGNSVFDDVTIYGQTNVKREMMRGPIMRKPDSNISADSLAKLMAQMRERRAKEMEKLKKNYPGDVREFDEMEKITGLMGGLAQLQKVYPDSLFDDKYVLKIGNKTFKMYHNAPSYSASDIIIYIPEERALIIGDIFNTKRIPYFSLSMEEPTDLDAWEKLFSEYVSTGSRVKHFVGTHGEGIITAAEIRDQFKYLRKLYEEVKILKGSGKTAEEIITLLPLDKFPYLSAYNPYFYGTPYNIHQGNIRTLWNQIK